MTGTATKPTVYEAWSNVMATVKAVAKTGHNKQQDYNFRGIDGVVNAAGPAMREHGVFVMPGLISASYRDVEVGKNRTLMRETTVKVRYTIIGPAGDRLVVPDDPDFGVVPGESMDSGDKGTAKAMSVAYRIFLLQALTIPTHEPDADATSYERSARADTPDPDQVKAADDIIGEFKHLASHLGEIQTEALKAWFKKHQVPAVDKASRRQVLDAIKQAEALRSHTGPVAVEQPEDQDGPAAGDPEAIATAAGAS